MRTVTFVFSSTVISTVVEEDDDNEAVRIAAEIINQDLGADANVQETAQEIQIDGEEWHGA